MNHCFAHVLIVAASLGSSDSLRILSRSSSDLYSKFGFDSGAGFGDLNRNEVATLARNFKPKGSNLHLLLRKEKKPVLFIHLHKSLGTWACMAVVSAGATVPSKPDCNTLDDGPWHLRTFEFFDTENTCKARKQMNDNNHYDFEAVERHVDFDGGDICPEDMYTSVIFRDPLDRIKSQMTANMQTWAQIQTWRKDVNDRTKPHSFIRSHIGYDNFYIRSFIGRGFFLGSGKITEEHLELAKRNLAKVDAVIDAQDLLTQIVQLEALTGYDLQNRSSHMAHNNGCIGGSGTSGKRKCSDFLLPKEGEQLLFEQNALDRDFYKFAQKLAKTKTDLLLQQTSESP